MVLMSFDRKHPAHARFSWSISIKLRGISPDRFKYGGQHISGDRCFCKQLGWPPEYFLDHRLGLVNQLKLQPRFACGISLTMRADQGENHRIVICEKEHMLHQW